MLGSLGFFAFFLTSVTSPSAITSSSPSPRILDGAAAVALLAVGEWSAVGCRLRLRLLSLEGGGGLS